MVYEHNPIAQLCKLAREWIDPSSLQPVQIRLRGTRKKDGRQFNLPTVDELVVLIVGDGEYEKGNRDIVIHDRHLGLRRITELNPSFMSMQYPLMFPYGEDGYTSEIKHSDAETTSRKKRTKVTMREYYAYRFQQRMKNIKLIDGVGVRCGRLRQKFMVDSFTWVEEKRLEYIRKNQKDIRKHSLRGLIDDVDGGETNPASIGRRIILPPSFPKGQRFMFKNYQDGLGICRWTGPPDLFITFTSNPKWPEITTFLSAVPDEDELLPSPVDMPDIIARVFKIKLDELMRDLTKNEFFGKTRAAIYTVEFQKRGLPHAHICIFLHPDDKYPNPEDIDRIVSAEIPDKTKDPIGYEAVMKFMVHGPCGEMNLESPCMIDGKCSKYYPRKFSPNTTVSDDGYPEYCRRNTGITGEIT